ncbi:MAG: hypothetical protein M1819_001549 [Sarea resinae]|nr:MAG: hypothetical protein M1819_001549 [Sarea resinae]
MSELIFTPTLLPPLGHTTTVERDQGGIINFTCLLELNCPPDSPPVEGHFTALLWWSVDGRGGWKPAPFERLSDSVSSHILKDLSVTGDQLGSFRSELFNLDLRYTGKDPLQFCLKYRFGDGPWLWSGSRIGAADGRIIVRDMPEKNLDEGKPNFEPADIFTKGSSVCSVERMDGPRLPRIGLFCIRASLHEIIFDRRDIDVDETKQTRELSLGRPRLLEHWMALAKIASPWMGPVHGGSTFTTEKDCLLLLFQRKDGVHVAMLPVSGMPTKEGLPTCSSYLSSGVSENDDLQNGQQGQLGEIVWRIKREYLPGSKDIGSQASCLVAIAQDARSALEGVIEYAAELMKSRKHASDSSSSGVSLSPELHLDTLDFEEEKEEKGKETFPSYLENREQWLSGLSYCTWNSLGADLFADKILHALASLDRSGIRICNLIIDDNWQTLDNARYTSSGTWSSFAANSNFDSVGGLKGLVSTIRAKYRYIRHIGVWHALHGYWDGITPGREIDKEYRTVDCVWKDNVNATEKQLRFVDASDVGRLYDEFYQYLSSCGIDCVKVDVQCRFDELKYGHDTGRLLSAYQDALFASSKKHLGGRLIVCMAHVPQILQYSLLDSDLHTPFFRTSDDFYPHVPESHAWHVFANSMNMCLFRHMNLIPDWDMFETSLSDYASYHAAARCLSGGPIFITDTPGKHDIPLLNQITAPSLQGHSVSLRPGLASTSDPYQAYKCSKLLKISTQVLRRVTIHAPASTDPRPIPARITSSDLPAPQPTLLLGIFNTSPVPLRDLFRISDIPDFGIPEDYYVIRSQKYGILDEPYDAEQNHNRNHNRLLTVRLPPKSWDILTFTPLTSFSVSIPHTSAQAEVPHPKQVLSISAAPLGLIDKFTGAAAIRCETIIHRPGEVVYEVSLCALGVLAVRFFGLPAFPAPKGVDGAKKAEGVAGPEGNGVYDMSVQLQDKDLGAHYWDFADRTDLRVDVERAWRACVLGSLSDESDDEEQERSQKREADRAEREEGEDEYHDREGRGVPFSREQELARVSVIFKFSNPAAL